MGPKYGPRDQIYFFYDLVPHHREPGVQRDLIIFVFVATLGDYLWVSFSFFQNFQFWALGRVRKMVPGTKFKKNIFFCFFLRIG